MVAGAALVACSDTDAVGPYCTGELRPGVSVAVRDSTSGESVVGGSTLLLVAGTYRESVPAPEPMPVEFSFLRGAHERPGTYEVTVKKSGYADWRGSAAVRGGECHVQTVNLIARLQRL